MNRFHRWFCGSDRWARIVEVELLPWVLGGRIDLGPELLEVGPGPGRVTDSLRRLVGHVTAIEIDRRLAASLESRLRDTNVTVVHGDATRMPFEDHRFSSVLCLTMLHHVPSVELQDQLLAEVHRVLRPGGWLLGSDSLWSWPFHLMHLFDTMVVVDPERLRGRMRRAGFVNVRVDRDSSAFRFRAECPGPDARA